MKTIAEHMKERTTDDLRWGVWAIIGLVYVGALIYGGVRAYSLFTSTLDPQYIPLALLGIFTSELSAIGLPIAYHFASEPGWQRWWVMGFTAVDIGIIILNSILDAARVDGSVLPFFLKAWGTYGLPALPAICLVGWLVYLALDPASKRRDMVAAVQASTHAAVLQHIQDALGDIDITDTVKLAAQDHARQLVHSTLGTYQLPAPAPAKINADELAKRKSLAAFNDTVLVGSNGHLDILEIPGPKKTSGGK